MFLFFYLTNNVPKRKAIHNPAKASRCFSWLILHIRPSYFESVTLIILFTYIIGIIARSTSKHKVNSNCKPGKKCRVLVAQHRFQDVHTGCVNSAETSCHLGKVRHPKRE